MISIHQSQFMPWLPLFFKILKSDVFVVLDDVQFQKNGVQNRNMIKTPTGPVWITVPVSRSLSTKINEVKLAQPDVGVRILKTLRMAYAQSPFFREVDSALSPVLEKPHECLHPLNMELFETMLRLMQVKTDVVFSSTLATVHSKGELVIEILKKCNDSHYLSGHGAMEYMDLERFQQEGIKVSGYNFNYTPYPQQWPKAGFVANLSAVDLLYNDLPHAKEYILENGSVLQEMLQ